MSQTSSLDEDELDEAQPDNSKKATKCGVRKFEDWLQKLGKGCDYHTVTSAELGELLREVYAEVKVIKKVEIWKQQKFSFYLLRFFIIIIYF